MERKLVSQLAIGERICDERNQLTFFIADHNHYGQGLTTLVSEYVIRVGCYDSKEPGQKDDRAYYGNNNYEISNINSWLNSSQMDWYSKTHELDKKPDTEYLRYNEQPYVWVPGFLYSFSDEFKDAVRPAKIPCLIRKEKGVGEIKDLEVKAFLLSRTEIGWGDENGIPEGSLLKLFENKAYQDAVPTKEQIEIHGRSWNPGWDFGGRIKPAKYDDPQIYDPKFGWWYWLRTPHLVYPYLVRVRSTYGALSYTMAYNDVVGIRPVLNVDSEFKVYSDGNLWKFCKNND